MSAAIQTFSWSYNRTSTVNNVNILAFFNLIFIIVTIAYSYLSREIFSDTLVVLLNSC